MSRIYWDTMLFVYWLEAREPFAGRLRKILEKMARRGDSLCTGVLTLGELLTGPYRRGDAALAARVRDFLAGAVEPLLPFTADAAERYASIRAAQRIAPADALHLATAATAAVDLFLTNDRRLVGLTIPGIQFVAGLDVNLF